MSTDPSLYWSPGDLRPHAGEQTFIEQFIDDVNSRRQLNLKTYWDLHRWSTEHRVDFWSDCWDHLGVIGDKGSGPSVNEKIPMNGKQEWFPGAKFNFAENLLMSHNSSRSTTKLAVISTLEGVDSPEPLERGSLTYAELYDRVNFAGESLKAMGIVPGDVVATFAASNLEMVITFLAATSIGAIFTSTPAEFGVQACVDRYSAVRPKVLITIDAYRYNGKRHAVLPKAREVARALGPLGLQQVILVRHAAGSVVGLGTTSPTTRPAVREMPWETFINRGKKVAKPDITFYRGPFQHPAWIVYSSGTSGKPKAIIAPSGGLVLARKITNRFHLNLDERDTMLQFANTGWIVYNLSLNFLATGGTLVCYDGSPFAPTGVLWRLVEKYNKLGVSPRYLQTLAKAGFFVNQHHDVSSLKVLHTTGSPVTPDVYNYVETHISRLFLSNNCGGTEIGGGILHSVPCLPIYRGQLQVPVLGMDVAAFDVAGKPTIGSEGAMVIRRSFPNMPIGFVNDPEGSRYQDAYFKDFLNPPAWNMQDSIWIDPITKGTLVLGRLDGILNPNGVRFGSAGKSFRLLTHWRAEPTNGFSVAILELYNVIETQFGTEIVDSIAVPLKRTDGDEDVVLFLKLAEGVTLDSKLKELVKGGIAKALSLRHVPKIIEACPSVPVTMNGKKLEASVKKLINGGSLRDVGSAGVENPAAFNFFASYGGRGSKL